MDSCIDPYNPNVSKYENLFVVDGEINNLPGPYKVKLSRTFKYQDKVGVAVTGAKVKIIDNTGAEVELKETSNGLYMTDSIFRGVPGNSYKVQIMANNETYESGFEILKKPIPINRFYWEYDSGVRGVQLLLDSHDSTNSSHFYIWTYDETWKFRVPIDKVDKPEWKTCYQNSTSYNFDIATSIHRNGDIIERHPLLFIGENTNRLFIRYTMQVKQFILSEQAYKFFKDLNTLNQDQGTLFDPIPYSLIGNMKNLTNKEVPVLGYFLVAGGSEERIFIDRKDLPKDFNPTNGFPDCNTEYLEVPWIYRNDIRNYPEADSVLRLGYGILDRYNTCKSPCSTAADSVVIVYFAKPYCFNCTLNGTNKVPDFWIEKESN